MAAAAGPKSASLAAEPGDLSPLHAVRPHALPLPTSMMCTIQDVRWMRALDVLSAGNFEPLGASDAGTAGINFALHAPAASSVQLCLFDGGAAPLQEVAMTKQVCFRTHLSTETAAGYVQ